MLECDGGRERYVLAIAQPTDQQLDDTPILALLASITGKIAEGLPMAHDEKGKIAQNDHRKTGDDQGIVTTTYDDNKQENRIDFGKRCQANQDAR